MSTEQHVQEAEIQGRYLEAGFRSLFAKAYSKGVSEEQYNDLRTFFFGGAVYLHGKMMGEISDDIEATEAEMKFISELKHEINVFVQEFKFDLQRKNKG